MPQSTSCCEVPARRGEAPQCCAGHELPGRSQATSRPQPSRCHPRRCSRSCGNCCCRWHLGFSHPLPRVQKGATFTRRRGDTCFCIAAPARSSSYTLEQRGASGAVTEQSAVASDAAASPTASAHLDAVAPTPLLFWRW